MFTTTFESYITIGWTVYAPVGKVQHQILQLVQFSNFLNFQNHREHVYNNFWKLHRNRMNGACSCWEGATPGTPASTIFKFFKFPKPPRGCLQQLVKVSSQSDERCGLLYGTDRQTDTQTHRQTDTQTDTQTDKKEFQKCDFLHWWVSC